MASSEKNTAEHVGRDGAGRWTGSGNPGGRPRKGDALAEAIRRKADPDELADIALKIARESKSEALRLQALAWLQGAGYTKPAERHELAVEQTQPQVDVSHIPLEERMAMWKRLQGPALGAQPDGVTDDNRTEDGAPCPERGTP